MATFVGKPLPRLEDRRFLTGQASFTADLDLPDQAYAVVVRSPHAHAEIEAIDAAAARATPGVLAVYTSDDLRAAGIGPIPSLTRAPPFRFVNADGSEMADASQYPLSIDRVRYVGEPVAVVVALTLAQARDGAELVEVSYRPMPAVTEVAAALADDTPVLWPELASNRSFHWDVGDRGAVADRLHEAGHVVTVEVDYPREIVAFMEPRAAIGS
jgi:carbon-monoxide dehydrogenase large subunit